MAVEAALDRVREWMARPNVTLLIPGPRYLEIAFGLLESVGTGANLTTDVQLAAHAIEEGAEMCSSDSDFARFAQLSWVNPLQR
jgi:predicted nucleic acid-binding protein